MASYDKYGFDPTKQKADMSALETRIAALESRSFSIKNIFPVGYVFMTMDNGANPNNLFPGTTWEKLPSGRMLVNYDVGNNLFNSAGKTGGAWAHSHTITGTNLTVNQIPHHTHIIGDHRHNVVYNTSESGYKDDGRLFRNYEEASGSEGWPRIVLRASESGSEYGMLHKLRIRTGGDPMITGRALGMDETNDNQKPTTYGTGGGNAHTHGCNASNAMPPYVVCHMWKRTA